MRRIVRSGCLWGMLVTATLAATSGRAAEPTIIRSRVLLPDGKPAAGAELYWPQAQSPPPKTWREIRYAKRGASDAEGGFQIALSPGDLPTPELPLYLVAHKAGFGIDWRKVESSNLPAEITLRLVEDRPIRGRIIDTEGRPVAGARIVGKSVLASRNGSLDTFLTALERSRHDAWQKLDHGLHSPLDLFISAASDRDGRFELSGIGVERLASLEILADGYAADQFYVANREGFDAGKYNDIITEFETPFARQNEMHPRLAGPNLDYIAEGELVVRGKILTGPNQTPVGGAVVYSYGRGQGQLLSTKSDEQGRYELHGLRRNRQNFVSAPAPDGSDFLSRSVRLDSTPRQASIDVDLELKRGVVIEGRVFDQATSRGVSGEVKYVPLPGNEFANQPGFDHFIHSYVGESTADDGHYRLVVIPGPGVLMAGTRRTVRIGDRHIDPYRRATLSEADRQRVLPMEDGIFTRAGGTIASLDNAAKVVDLPPDSQPATCDLLVDAGKTLSIAIEDDEGRPVRDAFVSGLAECWPFTFRIAEPTCTIYALGADRPRRICILHPERGLAASLTLTGDEQGPLKVRLGAAAAITGRALEAGGEPIADAFVTINYAHKNAREIERFVGPEHPAVKTDAEGRFEVGNIVPGERFALDFRQDKSYFRANLTDEQRRLKAGQKLELEEMTMKQLR